MKRAQRRYSETGKCLITWHIDGTLSKQVTPQAVLVDPEAPARFAYEREVNEVLVAEPPPVLFAPLVNVEQGGDVLRFQAVKGEPYGPKYPSVFSEASLAALLDLIVQLQSYSPRDPRLRRYDCLRELYRRLDESVMDNDECSIVDQIIRSREWPFAFAHGDLTPRNVLSSPDGPVLIDWEFAGWYPLEYDRAFLWLVLAELPARRVLAVESLPGENRASFWLCAYLIQVMHLGMWARRQRVHPFLARYLETKQQALTELIRASTTPNLTSP